MGHRALELLLYLSVEVPPVTLTFFPQASKKLRRYRPHSELESYNFRPILPALKSNIIGIDLAKNILQISKHGELISNKAMNATKAKRDIAFGKTSSMESLIII